MSLPSILDAFACRPGCPVCKGTGHVCEDHPDRAWEPKVPEGEGCRCGAAGMPCPMIGFLNEVVESMTRPLEPDAGRWPWHWWGGIRPCARIAEAGDTDPLATP